MADYRRICLTILAIGTAFASIGDVSADNYFISSSPGSGIREYYKGTDHEVRVYVIRGRVEGPTFALFAGIHGDERAAYLAAARYTNVVPMRGTLIVVPRLNLPAVVAGTRHGLTGDMNRQFNHPVNELSPDDHGVVALAKLLISQSDFVLSLHQGSGFYSSTRKSKLRNPSQWGQTYVIDAATADLEGGRRLDLKHVAQASADRSNLPIKKALHHFRVRDTETLSNDSSHKEQRGSLTYYALVQEHKMAFGIEATKHCSIPQAVALLSTAVNSMLCEVGIPLEQ